LSGVIRTEALIPRISLIKRLYNNSTTNYWRMKAEFETKKRGAAEERYIVT
jgi:hypothetical protein